MQLTIENPMFAGASPAMRTSFRAVPNIVRNPALPRASHARPTNPPHHAVEKILK
jgi:hypothetical protein